MLFFFFNYLVIAPVNYKYEIKDINFLLTFLKLPHNFLKFSIFYVTILIWFLEHHF